MSIPEYQARLKANIWQTLAQRDIDLTALPKETQEALVDAVTTAALVEIDTILGETYQSQTHPSKQPTAIPTVTAESVDPDPFKEDTLWTGRPFLSLMTEYIITDERLRIIEGVLGKSREDIELIRIQDVDQSQTMSERLLNIGDLTIRSHDRSNPIILLKNIKDPQHVHEILRRAILNARKKHGLYYREEM